MSQKIILLIGVLIIVGGVLFLTTDKIYEDEMPMDTDEGHMHDDGEHMHEDEDEHEHDDEGEHMHDEIDRDNIPTSADNAPEGSIHNLPVPDAVSAVRIAVANELGISEGVVIVMTAYEKEWPNGCLGLAREGEFCIQVITPGYEVTVQAQGTEHVYRTNSDGSVLRKE